MKPPFDRGKDAYKRAKRPKGPLQLQRGYNRVSAAEGRNAADAWASGWLYAEKEARR